VKLTIHASESVDEDALLLRGEGFFMDFYSRMNVNWEVPGCSPVEFLSRTGVLAAKPLLAHCVTVSDSDLELIHGSSSRIAHCPKSNAKFGHGYAPFEKFLDLGIAVGLGSDSVASNNACDLIEEARFATLGRTKTVRIETIYFVSGSSLGRDARRRESLSGLIRRSAHWKSEKKRTSQSSRWTVPHNRR
jgi:cytosine/adenosine deaminase-related metal-dependent hydrolase